MEGKILVLALVVLLVGMVSGYNATQEVNITSAPSDIMDDFYQSIDLGDTPSTFSNYIMFAIIMGLLLVGLLGLLAVLGGITK